jgi:hypothetical protein
MRLSGCFISPYTQYALEPQKETAKKTHFGFGAKKYQP